MSTNRSCPILVLTTVMGRRRDADAKKTVKNYQGPVVLCNLSMWFFEAVLEYRGKHNSNIGKKGVLNWIHGQDWVRIADVVIAFLMPNRRKSKIGLRPEKKLIRPKFCFPKYTVQAGCTRAWAVHEKLASNVTILNLVRIVRCGYNTSEPPLLGFYIWV